MITISELIRYVDREDWSAYRSGWRQVMKAKDFAKYTGVNIGVDEALTATVIEDYLRMREDCHNNSPATVNAYAAVIGKLCTYALQEGHIDRRPKIRKRRGARTRNSVFTRQQEAALCLAAIKHGQPNYAGLFVWLAETGMRIEETSRLVWSDIDTDRALVSVRSETTKTDKSRLVGISPRAKKALKGLATQFPGPFAFYDKNTHRNLWRKFRQEFDWMTEDHVMHTFRHTCASRLVQNGASIYQVQRWLGHSSITQTERYAKFGENDMANLATMLG